MKTPNQFTAGFFAFVLAIPFLVNSQHTWLNPLPQGNWLRDIAVVGSQHSFAAGGYGTIMKTINGGSIWDILNLCEQFV